MCCQMHIGWQLLTQSINKQTYTEKSKQTRDEDGYNLLLKQLMFILSLIPIYNIIIISPSARRTQGSLEQNSVGLARLKNTDFRFNLR